MPPSQRACEQLDREAGLTESEFWLKPPVPPPQTDGAGALLDPLEAAAAAAAAEAELTEFERLEVAEALRIVTTYLRSAHRYCHWCGQKYESVAAMDAECPGDTYEDHQ